MKKITFVLLALASAVLAASCQKDELKEHKAFTPMTISAVSEGFGTMTKTEMAYKYDVLWSSNDKIYVTDGTSSDTFTLTDGAGTTKGTFTQDGSAVLSDEVEAYYPESIVAVPEGFVWPANQTDNQTVPMYCKTALSGTADEQMNFSSLGSMLQIAFSTPVENIYLKSIEIKAGNKAMSGKFHVDENGQAVIDADGTAGIRLDIEGDVDVSNKIRYFNLAIPAGEYRNLSLVFTANDGSKCKLASASLNLAHNTVGKISIVGKEFKEYVPEMVDLGLSVKWASFNVGATAPEETGDYFQWGATENVTSTSFNLTYENAPFFVDFGQEGTSRWSMYVPKSMPSAWGGEGDPDGKTVLEPQEDAALHAFGEGWRMPTKAECQELIANCTKEYTVQNGVKGMIFTSKENGNSIFLPLTGYRKESGLYAKSSGWYLSASLSGEGSRNPLDADLIFFNDDETCCMDLGSRACGFAVRPVYSEKPVLPDGAILAKFTVNAEGKKVYFSQGNLRYAVDTGEWSFFDNQWNCGASTYEAGHDKEISLFTWGYNPEKSIVPDGAELNVSRDNEGDDLSQTEDWGYVFGGESSIWRTLTKNEWEYLFYTRTVNGGTGAGYSYSLDVTCQGKKGIVLYPDNYSGKPLSGVVAPLPEGVVFLPGAGVRIGNEITLAKQEFAYYWSSSAAGLYNAYSVACLYYSDGFSTAEEEQKRYGHSVRLVAEVQ